MRNMGGFLKTLLITASSSQYFGIPPFIPHESHSLTLQPIYTEHPMSQSNFYSTKM